jgi:uncharacterized protein (TIGR02996 family)
MARRRAAPIGSSQAAERAALFAGVKAEPDDDAPRLVLADWLEDQGDEDDRAHAELIRVQCEIVRLCAEIIAPGRAGRIHALLRDVPYHNNTLPYNFSKLTDGDPRVITLREREKALLGRWREEGRRIPVLRPGRSGTWYRGLAYLYLKRQPFKSRDMAALAAGPFGPRIDQVALESAPSNVGQIARSEMLAHLSGLEIGGMKFGEAELKTLLASPHLSGLRRLDTGLFATAGMIKAATSAPQSARLTHLYYYSCRLDAAGFGRFEKAELPALKALHLAGNSQMGPAGAKALAAAPFLGHLHDLLLTNNGIGPKGMEALATGRHFRCPARLEVGTNALVTDGLRALLAAPGLEGVAVLELSTNGLDDAALGELAATPRLRGLVSLEVNANPAIGPAGAEAIAASPHLAGLASLDLRGCPIGEDGARALIESPHLRRLQLNVLGCGLSEKTLAALGERFFLEG